MYACNMYVSGHLGPAPDNIQHLGEGHLGLTTYKIKQKDDLVYTLCIWLHGAFYITGYSHHMHNMLLSRGLEIP